MRETELPLGFHRGACCGRVPPAALTSLDRGFRRQPEESVAGVTREESRGVSSPRRVFRS